MSTEELKLPSNETLTPKHVISETQDSSDDDVFDISQTEHEIVKTYQPKYLDAGGEHIVYDIPEHQNVVVKVNVDSLTGIIEKNVEAGLPTDHLPEEYEERMSEYAKTEAARYKRLKTYFGKKHVLNQRKYLIKVPVTEQILRELYGDNPPATPEEAWAVVVIQKRTEIVENNEHLTISSGYSEHQEEKPKLYDEVTNRLVYISNQEIDLPESYLTQIQPSGNLRWFLEQSTGKPEIESQAKDFIQNAIRYSNETGESLDLAGADNVAFGQTDGEWNYILVDALYPMDGNMIDQAKTIVSKLNLGVEIDEGDKNVLMNAINYVRTVNGLAERYGVNERIELIPESARNSSIDFWEAIKP